MKVRNLFAVVAILATFTAPIGSQGGNISEYEAAVNGYGADKRMPIRLSAQNPLEDDFLYLYDHTGAINIRPLTNWEGETPSWELGPGASKVNDPKDADFGKVVKLAVRGYGDGQRTSWVKGTGITVPDNADVVAIPLASAYNGGVNETDSEAGVEIKVYHASGKEQMTYASHIFETRLGVKYIYAFADVSPFKGMQNVELTITLRQPRACGGWGCTRNEDLYVGDLIFEQLPDIITTEADGTHTLYDYFDDPSPTSGYTDPPGTPVDYYFLDVKLGPFGQSGAGSNTFTIPVDLPSDFELLSFKLYYGDDTTGLTINDQTLSPSKVYEAFPEHACCTYINIAEPSRWSPVNDNPDAVKGMFKVGSNTIVMTVTTNASWEERHFDLWARFEVTPTRKVKVVNENGDPVWGAWVYRNGTLVSATGTDGMLKIPDLKVGDQLAAIYHILERSTAKENHSQGSLQNWAYRVYITSVDIDNDGNTALHTVTRLDTTQVLTVTRSNPLIGFNIVVSVEWDASAEYLKELAQGFENASEYLYDASDGQMLFRRVTIYDNGKYWADADYQIRASNQEWPRAHVGGILKSDEYIFLGRYFPGEIANWSWNERFGYRTQVHEFGHYGLYLYDEYYYWSGLIIKKVDSQCTLNRTNTSSPYSNDAVASSLMDSQLSTTEFCSTLSANPHNPNTEQHQENNGSCWDTIVDHYNDGQSPPRWRFQTPVSRGQVVTGPTSIPVADWTLVDTEDANTGTCARNPSAQATYKDSPLSGVEVWLEKSNGKEIYQGLTDDRGWITILGAADGDEVRLQKTVCEKVWGVLDVCVQVSEKTTVQCPSAQGFYDASNGATVVVLEQAPFTLDVTAVPGSAANQVEVRVRASTTLSGPPQVQVLQSGAMTPTDVAMAYDSSTDTYTGTIILDADLPQSGSIEVNATDTEGQSHQVFNAFNLSDVTVSENVTIYSADGQVELYLPAGSLSADGRLGIVPDSSSGAPPEDLVILSGPYNIQAESGLTLIGNANLTMKYLDTGGTLRHADLSTVQIYRWDDSAGQWVSLNSNVIEEANEVSASINTLGIYAAMAERQYNIYLPIVLKNR
jgi:hypothetical protein